MTPAIEAELWKLRSLPTPRYTALAVLALMLLGVVLVWTTGPGVDTAAIELSVGLPTWIASIVIGAWIVGLEYGQGTMRRTLTTDSRRLELIASKLAVALTAAAALTMGTALLAAPLFAIAASGHAGSLPLGETLEVAVAGLFQNLVYTVVGFALALLTRSMAGGMTAALAFAFVVDTALSLIPDVGDYALQAAVIEIVEAIAGTTELEGDPELGRAIPIVAAWIAALMAAAGVRFTRSDVD